MEDETHVVQKKRKTDEHLTKSSKKKQKKNQSSSEIHAPVIDAVKEAEKRIGQPIQPMNEDIFYRWSSLGRANYIHPKWQFLSNMSPFPVVIDGITYPTVEHFFHAMKWRFARDVPLVTDIKEDETVKKINQVKDAVKVKQLMGKNGAIGKSFSFSASAWNKYRPLLVRKAIEAKVEQHPGIKRLLLESDQSVISERKLSHRRSTPPTASDIAGMVVMWKGEWYGDNSSGKLWMALREDVIKAEMTNASVGGGKTVPHT